MLKEMTFHGTLKGGIEYFATVAGYNLGYKHFFDDSKTDMDRFFFAGNELDLRKLFTHHFH